MKRCSGFAAVSPSAGRPLSLFLAVIFLSSCASLPATQPQINTLVITRRYDQALNILENQKDSYGAKNYLLYLLDKGFILHLMGRYRDSIADFEKAKGLVDEMYTKSVTNIASTWMVNDYLAPYRGENFEHILINVFQALNYAALGDVNESLVEARDVDLKFSVLPTLYPEIKSDTFVDDGFVRLLMGLLYETNNNQQDLNDAYISYQKALGIYESKFYREQGLEIPRILKENLLALSQYFGFPEYEDYRRKFSGIPFFRVGDKRTKAEVFIIQYNGLSPLKHPINIPIPTPDGYATGFSFPQYDARYYETKRSNILAQSASDLTIESPTDLGEDIELLSRQALDNRKAAIYAKAMIRPAIKYLAEKGIENAATEKYGRNVQSPVKGVGSLFNLFSEKADLRSWQTLPAQIRFTRFVLEPGTYTFFVENFDADNIPIEKKKLGEYMFQAGEKKFLIIRTVQ